METNIQMINVMSTVLCISNRSLMISNQSFSFISVGVWPTIQNHYFQVLISSDGDAEV